MCIIVCCLLNCTRRTEGHSNTTVAAATPNSGSYFSSYNNAPQKQYQKSLKFQKQHPPSSRRAPTTDQILNINQLGFNAWKFECDPQMGTNTLDGFNLTFGNKVDACLLSANPVHYDSRNMSRTFGYFEVTIKELQYSPQATVVSVGLATKPYPPFRMMGWNKHSVGYHSDDGRLFIDDSYGGKTFSSPYTQGDVIGCGYYPSTGTVFFTINGEKIVSSKVQSSLSNLYHDYHAGVGADGPCKVFVNVGQQPFIYNEANSNDVDIVSPPSYHQ